MDEGWRWGDEGGGPVPSTTPTSRPFVSLADENKADFPSLVARSELLCPTLWVQWHLLGVGPERDCGTDHDDAPAGGLLGRDASGEVNEKCFG